MYICLCKGISEAQFDEIIDQHQGCLRRIAKTMGLDESCCGRCEELLPELIANRVDTDSLLPAS